MSVHEGHGVTLHHADCLDVLRSLPDASVDSVVTDPPYGLEFMGKDWDAPWKAEGAHWREASRLPGSHSTNPTPRPQNFGTAGKPFQDWCEQWARECLRVLKPGGHMLAFGGTRTWHRLACAVEDAGFEVRDSIAWLHGQGFPKNLDVSKAIDKRANVNDETHRRIALVAEVIRTHREAKGMERAEVSRAVVGTPSGACWNWEHQQLPSAEMWPAIKRALDISDEFDGLIEGTRAQFIGAERAVIGKRTTGLGTGRGSVAYITDSENRDITAPATPDAEQWAGWGTALKPAFEPVVCARKPLSAVPLGEEVDRLHHLIGGLLWLSLSPAKRAELTSPSSPAGQHEATCVSALVSAALDTSPDASDETATFSSPALASTSSSIASSWSATLGALSARTRTSTTSTASSTTTALRTLNSLLGPITSQTTMPRCGCLVAGPSSPAPSAAASSSDEWAKWLHTLSASVPESATEGIALAVASALASIAADLSADLEAASSAGLSATTSTATRTGSGISAPTGGSSPAFEPVVVARKPLAGTVAANVLEHGTGALNIDGCRVGDGGQLSWAEPRGNGYMGGGSNAGAVAATENAKGRWPANVILDCEMAEALDEQSGESRDGTAVKRNRSEDGRAPYKASSYMITDRSREDQTYGGQGGASRFFYVAKADASERPRVNGTAHPTVKPLDLMRWLVRLVTPPGGTVLEPFAGSGTTVEACIIEGFQCIAIEREADYLPLIRQRIDRRRDPVEALRGQAADLGLFDLLGGEGA